MVFSLEEIDEWRKEEPETNLILVRSDTVPDDIREIHAADGLLTARGNADFLTNQARITAEFLELARQERLLGTRSLIDVLSGETALINAESFAASADADVGIALAIIIHLVGKAILTIRNLAERAAGESFPIGVEGIQSLLKGLAPPLAHHLTQALQTTAVGTDLGGEVAHGIPGIAIVSGQLM